MLVHKDEHLCYRSRMMNVEAKNRMLTDYFSLSRSEFLSTKDLLCCKSQGISTDISRKRKPSLAEKCLLRVPLEMTY